MSSKQYSIFIIMLLICACNPKTNNEQIIPTQLFNPEKIIAEANRYLSQEPITVTAQTSERSSGGKNDFYSEGDYWWPNPEDPEGPYIQKDGKTNPENFVAHRIAMRNLSRWVASLTAAYQVTEDKKYADQALAHLRAWFLTQETMMNPSLLFAQAIKGKVTGRGIGIIDTIHLIEVAKTIQVLQRIGYLKKDDFEGFQAWFNKYIDWLTTHPYGLAEKDHGNNHSTWWAAQVAAFADLTNREEVIDVCRQQYKKLLNAQMDASGGFPDELRRTKPYNYSLFNIEGYAVIAEIASVEKDNLWTYESENGTLLKAIDFMLPGIQDKNNWTYPPDVHHFDEIPIQSATLLLASNAYRNSKYLDIWKGLSPERKSKEVDRNFPVRQLSLWVE